MTVTIQVTEADLQNGAQGTSDRCPVALALRRVLGDDWRVSVSCAYREPNDRRLSPLPQNVTQWICDFDTGRREYLRPITFTLEIP